jgi:hypothetical protein
VPGNTPPPPDVSTAARRVFIVADHGLAIVYFLQSEVVTRLLQAGTRIVLLTDDGLVERIRTRFGIDGLAIEGMRIPRIREYEKWHADIQWWLGFLRRVGGSNRINTEAMDSYVRQILVEASPRQFLVYPIARLALLLLRRSARARQQLLNLQMHFTSNIYSDLLDQDRPDLIVASTPGWRQDRYLLREAAARRIPTASVIVGWDNPSSYSLPGAPVDHIVCWSDIQKTELMDGSDWKPEQVEIGGIPIYDGYLRQRWQLPRAAYFERHGLDPSRKLLCYACSFVSFSPNYQNVEALARLTAPGELSQPSQLLVRLHPNHFWDNWLFAAEREKIYQLAQTYPHLHVVEPVPLGGELGYYSGEDMDEKASMMAHADVFLTVYSTMVVEAAIHDRPIISVCIDVPRGWGSMRRFYLRKYSLPLSRIGDWPTHDRFRKSGAGQVVYSYQQLKQAIEEDFAHPEARCQQRAEFVKREITYTDGSAGRRTADLLLALLRGAGR